MSPGAGGTSSLAGLPVVWHPDCLRTTQTARSGWASGRPAPRSRSAPPSCSMRSAAAGRRDHAGDRARRRGDPGRPRRRAGRASGHDLGRLGGAPATRPNTAAAGWCRTCSPPPGCCPGCRCARRRAIHGRVGRFCYDTMTLIGPGTWPAARAAADAALTAADLVAAGAPAAYALCRPPGHHAGPAAHGGSCYLNNAAIAAAGAPPLRAPLASPSSTSTPTMATAPRRSSTVAATCTWAACTSIRARGGFPHYVGYADERGTGDGQGANRNLPLAPGHRRRGLAGGGGCALCRRPRSRRRGAGRLARRRRGGVRSGEPAAVSADGYRRAAERIGALGPTVVVQEGGYDLASLGEFVVAALTGIRAGRGDESESSQRQFDRCVAAARLGYARHVKSARARRRRAAQVLEQQPGGPDRGGHRGGCVSREQPQHPVYDGGDRRASIEAAKAGRRWCTCTSARTTGRRAGARSCSRT